LPKRFTENDPHSYYEWIKNWDEAKIIQYCADEFGDSSDTFIQCSLEQVREIKKWAETLYTDESPQSIFAIHTVFTDIIWKAFYCSGNSSLSFANFHELLITPTNIQTIKKITKGFEYIKNGKIDFLKDGKLFAQISESSSLFFKIFYDFYLKEEEIYSSRLRDSEKDFSIKIWTTDNQEYGPELEDFIEKLLFVSSTKTGLNFRRYFFEEIEKGIGENNTYEVGINKLECELTPIRFFNLSNHTTSPRLKYLTFYQAIEFFYLDDKSLVISEKIKSLQDNNGNIDVSSVTELSKTLYNYSSEISNLKIVIEKRLNIPKLLEWLNTEDDTNSFLSSNPHYTFVTALDTNSERTLIDSLSNRIYKIRCSITHSKKGHNQTSLEPFIDDSFIQLEIPLIMYVSQNIINNSFEIG